MPTTTVSTSPSRSGPCTSYVQSCRCSFHWGASDATCPNARALMASRMVKASEILGFESARWERFYPPSSNRGWPPSPPQSRGVLGALLQPMGPPAGTASTPLRNALNMLLSPLSSPIAVNMGPLGSSQRSGRDPRLSQKILGPIFPLSLCQNSCWLRAGRRGGRKVFHGLSTACPQELWPFHRVVLRNHAGES